MTLDSMKVEDAARVAELAGQLGYPGTTEGEMRERIEAMLREPSEQLRVARDGDRVVGWIHFHLHRSLVSGPRVELAVVVVDSAYRGHGIGTQLVGLAEEWGRAQGLRRIRLSSRATRPDTHRLYLRLGYTINKTSHIFDKPL
jgi:GNAT superfamily N-acetyltransferase